MSLIAAITIFCLIAPSVTYAGLADDLANIGAESLAAINDITSPLQSLSSTMLIVYVFAIISLEVTVRILEWIISNPQWLDIHNSVIVTAGWELCKNLANMFLLLIFLVIAFGFILRIESVQSRKSLPRLIIVALLINFSRLFVGMIADMGTIFNNTIIQGHSDLVATVMTSFLQGMYTTILWAIVQITGDVVKEAIPFGSLGVTLAKILSLYAKGLFISSVPTWIFQICAATGLTLIFLIYIFLLAARVYIIQILAILSPLAFLCLILPQTKKYWDEWFQHLIQWTFVGTFLLFFLMIGLSAGNALLPNGNTSPGVYDLGVLLPIVNVPQYYLFYSFLFIYLSVSFWMVNRTMPMLAVAITSQMSGAATRGWNMYGRKAAGDAVRKVNEKATDHAADQKELQTKISTGEVKLSGTQKISNAVNRAIYSPVFAAHKLRQTTPEMETRRYQRESYTKFETKYGKDGDAVDDAMKVMDADKTLFTRMGSSDKRAFLEWGQKNKGSKFTSWMQKPENKFLDDNLLKDVTRRSGDLTKLTVGNAPELLRGNMGGELKKKILDSDKGREEMSRMQTVYRNDNLSNEEIENKAAMSMAAKQVMSTDNGIKNWKSETITGNEDLQEAIVANMKAKDVQKLGEVQGQAVVDKIHDKFDSMSFEKVVEINPTLNRATVTNPAVQEVFAPHQGVQGSTRETQRQSVNDAYNTARTAARNFNPNVNRGPEPDQTAGQRFAGEPRGRDRDGGTGGAGTTNVPRRPPGGPGGGAGATEIGTRGTRTFTPGAGGPRGMGPSREQTRPETQPTPPPREGDGLNLGPEGPRGVSHSRSGRTNIYPDDINTQTEPRTQPGQTNPNDPGRSRSGRTSGVHNDDLNP